MHLGSHIDATQLLQLMAKTDAVIKRQFCETHGQTDGQMKRDVYSLVPNASDRKPARTGGLASSHIEVPEAHVADLEQASLIRAGAPKNGEVLYTLTEDGRRAGGA